MSRVSPSTAALVLLTLTLGPACSRSEDTPTAPSATAVGLFEDITAAAGITFDFDRARDGIYFMPDSMAAGGALFDYDDDGDLDVYIVNGYRDPDGTLVTDEGANVLLAGQRDGTFVDATAASGLGDRGYGMGVAVGDIDNDGDCDVYVTNYGPDALYRNHGDGTFADVTAAAGLGQPGWGASAGFFDYDLDGFLDLFVTNYLEYDDAEGRDSAGRGEYASPSAYPGAVDRLYHNNGDGTFTDVSATAGIAAGRGKGLGIILIDLNEDHLPDIYVANDGERNFAWINQGDGTFSEQAMAMGLALNGFGRAEASMGIALGDTDGDGRDDILLTHLVQETNTLYRALGRGQFEDATITSGVGAAGVDYTGFGTAFVDLELDGDLDLLIANGRVLRTASRHRPKLTAHWAPYAEPNLILLNDGSGRFTDGSSAGGPFCTDVEVSRGLAVGDVDRDGRPDALVTNGNGTVRLYRNRAPPAGRWLAVRAVDPDLRRDAIGATVIVTTPRGRHVRPITSTFSYLSANEPVAYFGLGPIDHIESVEVIWPGGASERFEGIEPDRRIVITRGRPGFEPDGGAGR